jgi:hypothetical protein
LIFDVHHERDITRKEFKNLPEQEVKAESGQCLISQLSLGFSGMKLDFGVQFLP